MQTVPRTPEAAVPGKQQEAGRWIVPWPSTTPSCGRPIVHSEQIYFPLKGILEGGKKKHLSFLPKKSCFLRVHLSPEQHSIFPLGSGDRTWVLLHASGKSPVPSVCCDPHVQGMQDASPRDYEFKDWHS